MIDVEVIEDPAAAQVALEPIRSRLLAELAEPASAATLASRVGLTRQKVNYHLRMLEDHGLVRLVEERPRRGLTERIVVATARSYMLSPEVLGENAVEPERSDRLSARYLIALAARLIREVAALARGLSHLADNDDFLAQMGKAAAERTAYLCDGPTQARELVKIWRRIGA